MPTDPVEDLPPLSVDSEGRVSGHPALHPFGQVAGAQSITAWATGNRWDAPFGHWSDDCGTVHYRRDPIEPPGFDWTHRTLIPHAVVLVDGVMSAFDAARQPTTDPSQENPDG